jgi:Tfp pilus assembly protein PilV
VPFGVPPADGGQMRDLPHGRVLDDGHGHHHRPAGARPRGRTAPARAPRSEAGFTMVEVMVAGLLLVGGILAVLATYTGAVQTATTNNARVTATNLERELVETAREIDYDDLEDVAAEAQARGLGTGSPWTIVRRGTTYTVTASTCVFDSPTDDFAATAPASACQSRPAGEDSNGDDFRRVTFGLAWDDAGRTRVMSQTTLVVNPAGGLGPRIMGFAPLSQTITANVGSVAVTWSTTPAQSLAWDVDDGVGRGTVTGSTSFTATWSIGTSGSGSEVLDGAYTMSARAFDDRDIPGEARRADIVLNRRAPYAPTSFTGGHNTRAGDWVELEWNRNLERDVLGYRVLWAGADKTFGAGGDDQQVCPAPTSSSLLSPSADGCTHAAALPGTQKYEVVAVDRDAANALRAGDATVLTVPAAGAPPASPLLLTSLTLDGQPRLTWVAPLLTDVAFYRIYRDGTQVGLADRYDRTSGALVTTYTDTDPGDASHRYWVTTVDSHYNESDPIGPVTWTP